MTLREWLEQNTTYTEATAYYRNGDPAGIWYGDDDPKYDATVISVTGNEHMAHITLNIERS